VLTGTDKGMQETFGSTCHGAGRARSRNSSRNKLDYTASDAFLSRAHTAHVSRSQEVLAALKRKGIAIRVASPKLVMEEVRNGRVVPTNRSSPSLFLTSSPPGARVVQRRDCGGGHVPRGGHKQEDGQVATDWRDQGMSEAETGRTNRAALDHCLH
jgi:hypothetical protein